ncbi:membrane or secreted protein [Mucilaginibacter myungsuensis]|uniref:Membrane or secreted protein n=1 Tax=Mucilaginibacter myungsuensis TaxID=649104 RepID=A0A929PXX6_9SPHI|nr:membrane or secreted protein [Mucilaginibacter myungsuensis]MBE9663636.1 membrane or secreted protein [Mucilaginibacter myungsuensis]MDN3599040.1 hypothetical protein [Mucilaginibacter myungsuensis]
MKSRLKLLAIVSFVLIASFVLSSFTQSSIDIKDLKGAWEYGPAEQRATMIVTDNIFSVAVYDRPGKKFVNSYGGKWRLEGNKMIQTLEWDAKDPARVGTEVSTDIKMSGSKLTTSATNETWERVDKGDKGDLVGAWIIVGNYENDQLNKNPNAFGPRRTMKVLSGSRFQWIAYNVGTKQFVNSGGGTYTAENGKYIENIDFFTKTAESVGKTVSFRYLMQDGNWRHKGQKSTGGPMDEGWVPRGTLEK